MSDVDLAATARELVSPGKGLLAADESDATIAKRFASVGLECTPASRLSYRRTLFTTPDLSRHISGVILFDETIRQADREGHRLVDDLIQGGLIPGIKVDRGVSSMPGFLHESVTEGLDGLRGRLEDYQRRGARFTKWRAVLTVGSGRPSEACMRANAAALGRFAALSQEAGMVPVVEPDVLMAGSHTLQEHSEATGRVIAATVDELRLQGVELEGTLLKTNMALPGRDSGERADPDAVAEWTLRCLRQSLPAAVPGVVFLSGGQDPEEATANLDALNRLGGPWELAFSFNRALLGPALTAWADNPEDPEPTHRALLHRAACNAAARTGSYTAAMERKRTPRSRRAAVRAVTSKAGG